MRKVEIIKSQDVAGVKFTAGTVRELRDEVAAGLVRRRIAEYCTDERAEELAQKAKAPKATPKKGDDLAGRETALAKREKELDDRNAELIEREEQVTDREQAAADLEKTKKDLKSTRTSLTKAKNELEGVEAAIDAKRAELAKLAEDEKPSEG